MKNEEKVLAEEKILDKERKIVERLEEKKND